MMRMLIAPAVVGLAAAAFDPHTQMNGEYSFANPTKASPTVHRGDDYFEVYSPVYTSKYGQVNWNGFSIALPQEIIKAWDGKTMAITGYEFDAVRSVGGVDAPCNNNVTAHSTCNTTSVPAWEQYNHHYGNSVSGKGVAFIKDPVPKFAHEFDPVTHMMGFDGYKFVSTEPGKLGAKPGKLTSTGGLPMGNGAESRKTFHFFPPGYGALVGSPTTTEIRPMFIDTKNRAEFGKPLDPSVPTRHGPVPENSNIPPSEMYSGMMECPCTDRYLKQFSTASTQQSGTCFELIGRSKQKKSTVMTSAAQCFEGATSLGMTPATANKTVADMTIPAGCSATAVVGGYEISYNSAKSPVPCGAKNATHPRAVAQVLNDDVISFNVDVDMANDLVTVTATADSTAWFGLGFGAQTMDGVCVGACPPKPGTNAIIFMPDGTVNERELGMHAQGTNIPTSVKIVSHAVTNGKRTFVVTRSLKGMTPSHYTFRGPENKIDFISSLGYGAVFGYHKVKASGTMYFTEVGAPTCLCSVGYDEGTLGGFAWGGQRCSSPPLGQMVGDPRWNVSTGINGTGNSTNWPSWNNNPIDTDNGGVNPTCSLKKYRGGLRCCHGNDYIADTKVVEQAINASTDFFQMKYRYYFEDADKPKTSTKGVRKGQPVIAASKNIGWFTEHGNNENDVPPCNPKTDNPKMTIGPAHAHQDPTRATDCITNITSNFTGAMFAGTAPAGTEIQLIHMLGHCHIGSLGMQLWNMSAEGGPRVVCQTWNDYGRTNGWMDEMGYLLGSRPCIYGDPADGFVAPLVVRPGDKLMSLKMSNNTHARYGDMALWEIKAAFVPAGTTDKMIANAPSNYKAEMPTIF